MQSRSALYFLPVLLAASCGEYKSQIAATFDPPGELNQVQIILTNDREDRCAEINSGVRVREMSFVRLIVGNGSDPLVVGQHSGSGGSYEIKECESQPIEEGDVTVTIDSVGERVDGRFTSDFGEDGDFSAAVCRVGNLSSNNSPCPK